MRDPYGLYRLFWVHKGGGNTRATWPEYDYIRRQSGIFSDTLAVQLLVARLEGAGAIGEMVSANYFSALGVNAALGRTLMPADDQAPGSAPVIVLSDALWKNRLGSDPNVIGRKIYIHGQALEVVGVTRPGFVGIESIPIEFWIPLSMSPLLDSGPNLYGPHHPMVLAVVGRLQPGISARQAGARLSAIASRACLDRSESERPVAARLESQATGVPLNKEVLAVFTPLLLAFILVLLIACANVANMMLARALSRQREIGVRLSLGASRSRVIRQLLTESLLLALPASAAGFLTSLLTVELGQRLMFATVPQQFAQLIHVADLTPDFRVFVFLFAAALLCTLAFGLAPAIQGTRGSLVQANRGEFANDVRPSRLRNGLVIAQVTVCVMLLICAAIMLRNARLQASRDVRISTHSIIDVRMQERFQAKAVARLRSENWVDAVASVWRAPLYGSLVRIPVTGSEGDNPLRAGYEFVSPEYFRVTRIPLLRGRNFTPEEADAEAPFAIVSEATAALLWPHQNPLGQSIRISPPPGMERFYKIPKFSSARVIGVVRDVITGWVGDGLDPSCIYFPTSILHPGNRSLLVRVKGDAEALLSAVDSSLSSIAPGGADQMVPLDQALALQIYPFRAALWLSSFLGGLALVLTISGIYGVLSYLVSQQTREIGIRMALGATTGAVLRLVLAQSMRLALWGLSLGAMLALGIAYLIATQFEMMDVFSPAPYLWVISLVAIAALSASFFPARKAVQVDPATTLRCS